MSRARDNGAKVPTPTIRDEADLSVGGVVVVASRLAERVSLAGRPDNAHLPLVPEGFCHGVRLGSESTLCGVPVGGLSVFPGLSFASLTFLARCDDCCAKLAATR